jgi:hypothetical protein
MLKTNINNLKIDDILFKKILKAIDYIAKYRSHYHFRKMGFKRIFPKISSGAYFFIHKKLGLFVKCSFTLDMISKMSKESKALIIPSIVLDFNEYECCVSQWIIQPIADINNIRKTYRELKDNKYFKIYVEELLR